MINESDLHSVTFIRELKEHDATEADVDTLAADVLDPSDNGGDHAQGGTDDTTPNKSTVPELGRVFGHYGVTRYIDTRNLEEVPSFLVTCVQRILIYNTADQFAFEKTPSSYPGYPALLEAQLTPVVPDGTRIRLIDYWPRTLNSAVNTDQSENQTTDSQVLRQHTSGSSTTTTNSFGLNASLTGGVGAEGPTGSATLGGNWEHSTAVGTSSENTLGSTLSHGLQMSGAASMTIKDWGSYATIVHPPGAVPSLRWHWGQEYPWNLFQFRASSGDEVPLPLFLRDRLGDVTTGWAAPPSELSMFGLDLVAHATWQVIPPPSPVIAPRIGFRLHGKVGQATHSVVDAPTTNASASPADDPSKPPDKVVKAWLSSTPFRTQAVHKPLDLELLALDPIRAPGVDNGAALGFSPDVVQRRPVGTDGRFRATSAANTLALRGRGFLMPAKDSLLKADLSSGGTAEVDVYFKLMDTDVEYSIILKHWKTDNLGCVLTFDINGIAEVVRHVDDLEAEGGGNNVTAISLRSLDFTENDFHDYLVLGMNRVHIKMAGDPGAGDDGDGDPPACGYVLRAIAVG